MGASEAEPFWAAFLRSLTCRGLRGVKLVVVADQLRARFHKLATMMEQAERNVVARMAFPKEHRTQIHSTNPLERINGEVKRRANVVGICPNDAAIVRLVAALLLDQNDEWAIQCRYMSLEAPADMSDNRSLRLPAIAA